MNSKRLGATISMLRKKSGMTQEKLALKLNVSNKTISRWESGKGYPEITLLPSLASVFGVTVDHLLSGERRGITVAGNLLVDLVKNVESYPNVGMLATVTEVKRGIGGCAANTAVDLAKMDIRLPISVIGKVGGDENGRFVLSSMARYGINCDGVTVSDKSITSFSDVISQPNGERTFFHARGANAEFCPKDIDVPVLGCSILHIGYILLLDAFDAPDPEYGTVMARFLKGVQAHGIKTSVDVVSSNNADYKRKIIPALKYCDYIIINELEAAELTSLKPYSPSGELNIANIKATMEYIARQGVRSKVVVHCKRAGFALDVPTGTFTAVPSLDIPVSIIKGSVGAGDAFCAGCLYALYNGYDDKKMLEYASSVAAISLTSENSTDGVVSKSEIEGFALRFRRKTL
ncbi:MAG: helix-turn-helix domain-containing protein [Clostridia bacterium]|nr:helix-turn-helix domain-containing protein [Clostridia bacterium]